MNPTESWIAFAQPAPAARVRLFCFAHAGGGASLYRGWQQALGDDVHVCPVQLPGRESRIDEAPIDRLDDLLAALDDALGPLTDLPFAVFGHSIGALIGFEFGRLSMARRGKAPIHLFVSASQAPTERQVRAGGAALSDDAFLARVGGICAIPQPVLDDPEARQLVLPALRADFAINDAYTYPGGAPLPCPISIFGAADDALVDEAALKPWKSQTSARSFLRIFPGDHFYLKADPDGVQAMVSRVLQREIA
jgi:surfactin synthase thioesterase subunit